MKTKEYFKLAYKYRHKKYPHGKIKQIFLDHWEKYLSSHAVRPVEDENILKMLACRTALMGKHVYQCPECNHTVEIPHSCKSRFCSVCGYIATENWIAKRFSFLLDCHYHHVVITVPAYFRWQIRLDRRLTLNLFARCAADTLLEWGRKRGYQLGIIAFFHAFNKNLGDHPHFHFLVTAGGVGSDGKWHYDASEIPGHILMKVFKAKFVFGMKNFFKKGKLTTNGTLSRVLYQISHQHDKHWQFFTERITKDGVQTIKYCVRYCKRMVISEMRIISYSHNSVVFWDSKMKNVLEYDTETFMRCLIQAIPDKYFHLIRNYGFYSNHSHKNYLIARKTWKPLAEQRERLPWRYRQMLRNCNDRKYPENRSLDPLRCPNCKIELILTKIIYPEPKYKRTLENIKLVLGIAIEQRFKLDSS